MKHRSSLLVLVAAVIACGPAPAPQYTSPPPAPPPADQPAPPAPPPTAPLAFDATGWTLLGSKDVDRRLDRDVIEVGKQDGLFDTLTMVVTDSDLELLDLKIVFGNGEIFEPKVRASFREGSRTRAIDFPGKGRHVKRVELVYRNTPGGGRAHVDIYAKNARGEVAPPATATPPAFDPKGWTLLSSTTVDGKRDKDVIRVGAKLGRFDKLTLVVSESDLELTNLVVTFGNGKKFDPAVRHVFKEGSRSRAIDLPGADRFIKSIALAYANLPGGGKAKLEIYGKDTAQEAANQARTTAGFDPTGWHLLGSAVVDGKRDKDLIPLGNKHGRIDQITLVVLDSDLELTSLVVTFGNGKKLDPALRHVFKEGSRSRVIDLPGADRFIRNVALAYANRPGGGKARVEIWGRNTAQGPK